MATATINYAAPVSMTVTNLNSNSSSATNAWMSAVVDNTSNLYLDALVQVVLDFANTAPANDKAAYVYAYGGVESGVYSNPISGTEGDATLLDITSNPNNLKLIGVMAYGTTNEIAQSPPFSVANAFGGLLPPYWGVVIVNYSGASLAANGHTVKWVGVKIDVA